MDARVASATTEKRDWLSWLRRKPAPPPPAPPPAEHEFDLGLRDLFASGWMNSQTNELAPGLPLSPEDVVIDVGCGDGFLAGFYAKRVRRSLLIDQAERQNAIVERLRGEGAAIETKIGDAEALPIPDAAASVVICTEVLEHVDDPAAVMRELVRIGRPGARYLLSVPGALSEKLQHGIAPAAAFEKPNHIRTFEPGELAALAQACGLAVEREVQHGFYFTLWWLFFWPTGIQLGEGSHPLLDAWAQTWEQLHAIDGGMKIKAILDALAPKVSAVIARKPG